MQHGGGRRRRLRRGRCRLAVFLSAIFVRCQFFISLFFFLLFVVFLRRREVPEGKGSSSPLIASLMRPDFFPRVKRICALKTSQDRSLLICQRLPIIARRVTDTSNTATTLLCPNCCIISCAHKREHEGWSRRGEKSCEWGL